MYYSKCGNHMDKGSGKGAKKNSTFHHTCKDGILMTDKCITMFYSLIISVFDKKHMLHAVILH